MQYHVARSSKVTFSLPPSLSLQGLIKSGGPSGVQASLAKVKTEAERLDVMDKAAGILAELLYTDQLLSQIKEYRTIILPVSVWDRGR